jgi:hypothetical protein
MKILSDSFFHIVNCNYWNTQKKILASNSKLIKILSHYSDLDCNYLSFAHNNDSYHIFHFL